MVEPRLKTPILLSIAAALATIGLKSAAYLLTDSVGLLSDALESLVNLVAAVTAFASLLYAAKPVDREHTYGHEKIEFFSSGLEGVLIVLAALGIAFYAVRRLLVPEPLQPLGPGLLIASAAALVNLAVGLHLVRTGRRHRSIVLEADGRHLLTDVWTSAGVIAGLGVVWLTGRPILDPLLALAVAGNILWTGFDLVRRAFNGLMDHALPPEEQARVRAAIEARLGPHMAFHALRTRQAGRRRFVDFHLLVPGHYTVKQAHALTGEIEAAIGAALEGVEVTVHIEPIEERAAWEDSALVPLEEAERREQVRQQHKPGAPATGPRASATEGPP
jgi:cation diffusion facilitator family transporter